MPLNARQFLDLAYITPGVSLAGAGVQGGGFNAAGARSQSNVFLLDGVSNIDTQTNQPLTNFRITDAIQEFDVQTSGATWPSSVAAPAHRSTSSPRAVPTRSTAQRVRVRPEHHPQCRRLLHQPGRMPSRLRSIAISSARRSAAQSSDDKTFLFLSYEGFFQTAPTLLAQRAFPLLPISPRSPTPSRKRCSPSIPAAELGHSGRHTQLHRQRAQLGLRSHRPVASGSGPRISKDHLTFRWIESRGRFGLRRHAAQRRR